jgi:hypothetical protein
VTAEASPATQRRRSPVTSFLIASAIAAAALIGIEDWRILFAQGHDQPLSRDFLIFYLASTSIWNGEVAKVFDPWLFSKSLHDVLGGPLAFTPFPYPPLAAWFIAPLAALPYAVAWPAWLVVTFGAFAATLRRFFATRRQWMLILLTAPASLVNIADGQNGFLSAALLCGGLLALERRPILAGVLIGLLTFKPQLGLLLPFVLLAGGYYRVFISAGVTTVALFAGSVSLLGWTPWSQYFEIGVPWQRMLLETGTGPFMVMVPTFMMSARILELPIWLGYTVQAIVALIVLLACCWAIRQKAPLERRIAVIMAGVIVAPPYCFNYDLPILVAAQVIAWPGYRALDLTERLAFALAWLLPVIMVVAGIAHIPVAPIIVLAQFFVLLRGLKVPAVGAVSADVRSAAA